MKRSKYTYFFDIDAEYVGYSYLSNDYVAFPIENKERVDKILKYPDEIITNMDVDIYKKLCNKKYLIKDDFNEYNFLLGLHRQYIHRTDWLAFCVIPTMACNCRCVYCYELHPSLKKSKMSREVVDNLKKYIAEKVNNLTSLNIGWFGGEPLLCMDIIEEISKFCLDLCAKEDILYIGQLVSNGVLLDKRKAQIITNCQIHKVQITLDGSKEKHDKTRVTLTRKPTFDIIYKNILNYLENDEKNRVKLRIHVSLDTTENDISEIIETLNLFDKKYRQRIFPYPHVIFSSCSEEWARGCSISWIKKEEGKIKELDTTKITDITSKIHEEIVKLDYSINPYSQENAYIITCEFDTDWLWIVRPDGYLNKCTVGIEKERSQAKLTKDGIEIFPERFSKIIKKEYSSKLYEHCQDCEYLPLCWRGCIYKHYQNPDINDFIKTSCFKYKNGWLLQRNIENLKYRYLKKKEKNENR